MSGYIYFLEGFFGIKPPKDALLKAKELFLTAREIDDTLADAYTFLAAISLYYDWDWTETENRLNKAIALNPLLVIKASRVVVLPDFCVSPVTMR